MSLIYSTSVETCEKLQECISNVGDSVRRLLMEAISNICHKISHLK